MNNPVADFSRAKRAGCLALVCGVLALSAPDAAFALKGSPNLIRSRSAGAEMACTKRGCFHRSARGRFRTRVAAVHAACFPEIQSVCAAGTPKISVIGACLKANEARLSDGCRSAMNR